MNKKLVYGLIFAAGSAIGSAVTWVLAKKKYEEIINLEVESARTVYNDMAKALAERNKKEKAEMDISSKAEEIKNETYSRLYSVYEPTQVTKSYLDELKEFVESNEPFFEEGEVVEESKRKDYPYIITPDEFGELDGYSCLSFTYYTKDKILLDDRDEPIDDPDSIVGIDNLEHPIDTYDDYMLYVRNDQRRCDYEILLEESGYETD